MPEISKYLLGFINLTLPGLIYLTSAFILLQAFTEDSLIKLLSNRKDNILFYISILIVVFSYVTGFMFHLAETYILHLFSFSDEASKISEAFDSKVIPVEAFVGYHDQSLVLLMIRHLITSFFCLVMALIIYQFRKHDKIENKGYYIFLYVFILIILTLSYLEIQRIVDGFKDELNLEYSTYKLSELKLDSTDSHDILFLVSILILIPIAFTYFIECHKKRKHK